jgi:serine/threonine protein kinase
MNADRWHRVTEIFHAALERAPSEREGFIRDGCKGDAALREDVEKLLAAHRAAESAEPAAGLSMPLDVTHLERSSLSRPAQIGPYKILDTLGEGGMGIVYLAEQDRPIRRRVALKVIKIGMDTREVVGRFESERQALALMDHPGIAQVYDADASEDGRPYFAMERENGTMVGVLSRRPRNGRISNW